MHACVCLTRDFSNECNWLQDKCLLIYSNLVSFCSGYLSLWHDLQSYMVFQLSVFPVFNDFRRHGLLTVLKGYILPYFLFFSLFLLNSLWIVIILQHGGDFSFQEAWFHLSDDYPIKYEAERLPPPIVADLNGDGRMEVLVATHDAKIQVIWMFIYEVQCDDVFTWDFNCFSWDLSPFMWWITFVNVGDRLSQHLWKWEVNSFFWNFYFLERSCNNKRRLIKQAMIGYLKEASLSGDLNCFRL